MERGEDGLEARELRPETLSSGPEGVEAGGAGEPGKGGPGRRLRVFLACGAVAVAAAGAAAAGGGLAAPAVYALFLLVFAALLWVFEPIPAFSVGLLVIGLEVALLGRPGAGFAHTSRDWEQFVFVIGNPLVWLFFGGFVLAAGMAQTGLDRRLVSAVMRRTGDRPAAVLLGVMGTAFALSMFVSNTATAALLVALVTPLVESRPAGDRLRTGLLLGVAVGANLGGMATLIGTPPNAIAAGVLVDLGHGRSVGFLEWMLLALPPAVLLLGGAWWLLVRRYARGAAPIAPTAWQADAAPVRGGPSQRRIVTLTLVVTVGLWLTGPWHGIPADAVAFVPIVVFTCTGVMGVRELRGLSWDVLFLIAGGLALGQALTATGLSVWLVERLPLARLGSGGAALALGSTATVLSTFMSNTAAANVLVPLAAASTPGAETVSVAAVALGASLAMCLPISTPPNALVMAGGHVGSRDFLRIGLPIGLVGPLLCVGWMQLVLERWIAP
jgi:solute carrier family 13 (sodium-dependent dicarboxylate transporter), member 2/3/5